MTNMPSRRGSKPSEEGYVLITVVFMLAIVVLMLSVAAPVVRKDIQRDREIETMHRGKQYKRAVKLYYKKFGAYPPNVDALVKTNEIRFLRKKYIDPTTGKAEWKPIRFGQNKTQTLGFFGQPIGGSTTALAGTGPIGGSGGLGGSPIGGPGASIAATFAPAGLGNNPNGPTTSTGTGGVAPDPTAGSGTGGVAATPGTAGSTDPNAAYGTSAGTSSTGLTGQTFGGGGIIGFSPNSPKQSILVYKKKNHYNEWEFFYDPLADQMMMQGGNTGAIGQPASATTTPIGTASTTSTGTTVTPTTPTP